MENWNTTKPFTRVSRTYPYTIIKRNSKLTLKKGNRLPKSRTTYDCREIIQPWFSMVENILKDTNTHPDYIINIDETPFGSYTSGKLIADAESQVTPSIVVEDRHKNATITLAVALSGIAYTSQLIWPLKNEPDEFVGLSSHQLKVTYSPSAWQTNNSFLEYLSQNCLKDVLEIRKARHQEEMPIILFLDGHASHKTIDVEEFCRANNIKIVFYPPHTSHRLQVLDCHLNATLKEKVGYYLELCRIRFAFISLLFFYFFFSTEESTDRSFGQLPYSTDEGEKAYRTRVAFALPRALTETLTYTNIIDAWKSSGLYSSATIQAKLLTVPKVMPGERAPAFKEDSYLIPKPTNMDNPPPPESQIPHQNTAKEDKKQKSIKNKEVVKDRIPTSRPTSRLVSKPPRTPPISMQISRKKEQRIVHATCPYVAQLLSLTSAAE